MTEIDTRKLLLQLAQILRGHFEYLHTLHDSTIALFDVLRKKNPEIETLYRQHPLVRAQIRPAKGPKRSFEASMD